VRAVAWAVVVALAIYFGTSGLYLAFGQAGALAIPVAMLVAVMYLTVRDERRRRR
jgi:hypothetical protein